MTLPGSLHDVRLRQPWARSEAADDPRSGTGGPRSCFAICSFAWRDGDVPSPAVHPSDLWHETREPDSQSGFRPDRAKSGASAPFLDYQSSSRAERRASARVRARKRGLQVRISAVRAGRIDPWEPIVFVLVAGSAVLHVAWNVLLKTAGDRSEPRRSGCRRRRSSSSRAAIVGWLIIGRRRCPPEAISLWRSVRRARGGVLRLPRRRVSVAATCRSSTRSLAAPRRSSPSPSASFILGERLGPEGFLGVAFRQSAC